MSIKPTACKLRSASDFVSCRPDSQILIFQAEFFRASFSSGNPILFASEKAISFPPFPDQLLEDAHFWDFLCIVKT